jgi:hypothetical protein
LMLIKMPFPACACLAKAGGFPCRETDPWKTTVPIRLGVVLLGTVPAAIVVILLLL